MTDSMRSDLFSLGDITEQQGPHWFFNIPIYQRLYVWGDEQINTLLEDIYHAFLTDPGQPFYLGTAMTIETTDDQIQEAGCRKFDLVDGQQRFTTLWLLANVLSHDNRNLDIEDFSAIEANGHKAPRLHFAIRDRVNEYLAQILNAPETMDKGTHKDTESLGRAQKTIQSFLKGKDQKALAEYINQKVRIVVNRAPKGMDLNKLFEVINNRGVQLQHHELLKSRMLHTLLPEERGRYAAIWDACADMSDFIERNITTVSPLKAHQLTTLYKHGSLAEFSAINKLLKSENPEKNDTHHGQTLADILKSSNQVSHEDSSDNDNTGSTNTEDTTPWAKGIIGFPLFLQHCLRIWLHEKSLEDVARIKDKQLLALFQQHFFELEGNESEKANNTREFLQLLWKLRVLWDDYVIKWVDQGEETVHQLSSTTISQSTSKNRHRYINRSRESDAHQGLSLLQSMLYHSQEITTHYWLTPYLHFLYKRSLTTKPDKAQLDLAFRHLCHLDDHLIGEDSDQHLVERSRLFMEDPGRKAQALAFERELALEGKHHGVHYRHYWFYKLDFVLWFEWSNQSDRGKMTTNHYWEHFRFTAKNSVEHVAPQTPKAEDNNQVSNSWMNSFGNLALVSRSINSEYSNLAFNEKQTRFENKRDHEKRPESLKMDLIYSQHKNWGDDQVKNHHKAMLKKLRTHYQRDFEPEGDTQTKPWGPGL